MNSETNKFLCKHFSSTKYYFGDEMIYKDSIGYYRFIDGERKYLSAHSHITKRIVVTWWTVLSRTCVSFASILVFMWICYAAITNISKLVECMLIARDCTINILYSIPRTLTWIVVTIKADPVLRTLCVLLSLVICAILITVVYAILDNVEITECPLNGESDQNEQ